METLTNPRGPSDPPAANRPRWMILNRKVNDEDADSSVADANTTAASCTSLGQCFSVSFAIAAPPATTRFYCGWSGGAADGNNQYYSSDDEEEEDLPGVSARNNQSKDLRIIAAHDNSILISMRVLDYFLYETGGAARPPTLSLLPGCYVSTPQFDRERDARHVPATRSDRPRYLAVANTAVLRAGDGEPALVAQLEVMYGDPPHDAAELCVLRPGREWELRRLHIEHHDGGVLPQWPQMDAAVAVGRRFICWVDYVTGFFVCDMAADQSSSKLRYVPLPVAPPPEPRRHDGGGRRNLSYCHNLAAAAGQDAVRFVSIAPRCCCGGPGESECERSRFAFNVTTWTLTLRMEKPMTWVKDGVLDCDELWHQPNYGSLPRVAPRYPIVSCDNPDIVCFTVRENHDDMSYDDDDNVDKTEWMIQIDTRSKELMSAVHADTEPYIIGTRLPANLRWQQSS